MSSKLRAYYVTKKVYLLTPFSILFIEFFNYWIGPDIQPNSKSSCVTRQGYISIVVKDLNRLEEGVIRTLFLKYSNTHSLIE